MGLSLFFGRGRARRENASVCDRGSVHPIAYGTAVFASLAAVHSAGAQEALTVFDAEPQYAHVDVSGRVAPRCGFAPGRAPGDTGAITISAVASAEIRFAIDCNIGFDIRVSAREGGLRRANSAMLSPASYEAGYRDTIAYRARLSVERDEGPPLTDQCDAAAMVSGAGCAMAAGRGLHSDVSARLKPASLLIALGNADPARLAAGNYSDVITIEVSP